MQKFIDTFSHLKDKLRTFFQNLNLYKIGLITLAVVFACTVFYFTFIKAPDNFPTKTVVSIKKGENLSQIADDLKGRGVIKSPFWFTNIVILFGGDDKVKAGDYYFENKLNVYKIAKRILDGSYGMKPVKIFIPEGYDMFDIASVLKKEIPNFDDVAFLSMAKDKEGFLFPDTYFFMPNVSPSDVISAMQDNFNEKIKPIQDDIKKFKVPLKSIVIMASIIEREARTLDTKKIVSGILWKRINIGMPLQVDATFSYVNGKNTYNLTLSDLKTESPYNTYTNKGLPPAPISNSGLESIIAAINPQKTKYFYYLSDNAGNMHYAVSFNEHLANKELYLK